MEKYATSLTQQFAESQTTIWVPCKNCLQLSVWRWTPMRYCRQWTHMCIAYEANCTEYSPNREATISSAGQDTYHILWNPEFVNVFTRAGHLSLSSFGLFTYLEGRDRGSTVVKVLCYKSVGRWFDPSWCQWIFHWHKILPIALWPWGRPSL